MSQAITVADLQKRDLYAAATMKSALSEDEKKCIESPLILGTTYPLNQSETKKISIGLQLRADGSIRPIVKLQNSSNTMGGGIVFESASWNLLQTHLPDISKYFDGNQKITWGSGWRTPSSIQVGDCQVVFTSSFGAKSVAFDLSVHETPAENDEDEGLGSQPKKRRKYSPSVVMQKTTFDGLINLMVCTDERFRRLQRNVIHVEKCLDVLCTELLMHIPANEAPENIDSTRVKDLIKNNFKSLKDAVQHRMDSSFIELTFGIVFLELTVLGLHFIVNEMKKALMTNNKSTIQ